MLRATLRKLFWRPYHFVRRFTDRRIFEYRFLRRSDALRCRSAITYGESADDMTLIDRVVAAYLRAAPATGDSMWTEFFGEFHADIDDALRFGPRARIEKILRDPGSSNLFYGFDNLVKVLGSRIEDRRSPAQALDGLMAVAEAMGLRRLDSPEGYRLGRPKPIDPDEVLAGIDAALGIYLLLPNPYPGHFGLATSRGVMTYRVPQAIYQAWRIRELTRGIESPRILEIGAGLGRTALYAHALGIRNYTIVDIPMTAVAQGYFLGRTVGDVALSGEPARAITLRSPEEFFASSDRYDLVVNVDSLTEMDRGIAEKYVTAIKQRAPLMLSINHESNAFTARELIGPATRHPYWLRRGYVEELARF